MSRIESDSHESVSRAEQMAAVIQGTGTSSFMGIARPVLLRIPESTLAEVDAMAKISNRSRNSIACELIALAVEEVRQKLNDEALSKLDETTFGEYVRLDADTSDRMSVKG